MVYHLPYQYIYSAHDGYINTRSMPVILYPENIYEYLLYKYRLWQLSVNSNILYYFDDACIFKQCFESITLRINSCYVKKGDKTLANDQNHATKSDVCIYPPIIIMSRMKEKTQSAVIVFVLDNFTLYISSFPSGTYNNLLW